MTSRRSLIAAAALAATLLGAGSPERSRLPYAAAGLTGRQAAAHLLDRFTFGPRPGDVDSVLALGPDAWLDAQLAGDLSDPVLDSALAGIASLGLSEEEIARTYPQRATLVAQAIRDGVIERSDRALDRSELRKKLLPYASRQGFRPEKELLDDMVQQKILRAVESRDQLREVMTDFWFNHFNVATTDNQARRHILGYERDAIRPNALGTFRSLLEASAKHPAMLFYLDNAQSSAADTAVTLVARAGGRGPGALRGRAVRASAGADSVAVARKPKRGINENYARELMELHTLGVDGGYTQRDVIEVARALTGWTVMPEGAARDRIEQRLAKASSLGFVRQGEFLFRPDIHDAGAKQILGVSFPAGGGLDEGERVLDIVVAHPSTAHHIALKLAQRFVSDNPPASFVDRLARVYLDSHGDIRTLIRTIAESPEFWSPGAMRAKIKSPFELAVSAVRATDAHVESTRALARWIAQMGEPLYAYLAPTGYPDRAETWINSGALLTRMNFGLSLAANGIAGVRVDLPELNQGREPESSDAALATYARLLMPERNLDETLRRLRPTLADPSVAGKIASAAGAAPSGAGMQRSDAPAKGGELPFIVGMIVGSPEFQRR
jgi:uncharacterized protein (DUF1800 family)